MGEKKLLYKKIIDYFHKDYDYNTILHKLYKKYDIQISRRTLSRILDKLKLKRKNLNESPIEEILVAVFLELEGSGCNFGYRSMWKRVRKVYNLTVKQKTIMFIMQQLDPEGVEARCRYRLKRREYHVPGPNYIWHADGHDKLKRYGFAIYGCIDGFSKKIIFLNVSISNNDPQIIGHYYLKAVEKFGFVPTLMRTDNGTEATLMEDLHMALRFNHEDELAGKNSFLRGKSTHNQRIESYWRQFRRQMGNFYMELFKEMGMNSDLNVSNPLHIECLRYCFGALIKEDIELSRKEWNEHRIRRQNCRDAPYGIPNKLFHWPDSFGAEDCKKNVDINYVKVLLKDYTKIPHIYSKDFDDLVKIISPNFKMPLSIEEAYIAYMQLMYKLNLLQNCN